MLPPLRPFQSAAIQALQKNSHLICIAATGSGKSRIYEEILLDSRPRTLLVTPLTALARQQKRQLEELGLQVSWHEKPSAKTEVWIVSPETLHRADSALQRFRPEFLVVDECHCLWEWGESFRPAFRCVPQLAKRFGIARSLWLTATLPLEARRELKFQFDAPMAELGEFELPETLRLSFQRVPWSVRPEALLQWLKEHPEPGILFVSTRQDTQRLCNLIQAASGRGVAAYHAGKSLEERRSLEQKITKGEIDVVVATSAFGLGIHQPRLRWALLWQVPTSVLSLAQALGRVGRGTQIADAGVFWHADDFRLMEWVTRQSDQGRTQASALLELFTKAGCRAAAFDGYFSETHLKRFCGRCDTCLVHL